MVIMNKLSLPLMSMARKQLLFLTLMSKIVDKSYAISKYMGKCRMIYRSLLFGHILNIIVSLILMSMRKKLLLSTFILY